MDDLFDPPDAAWQRVSPRLATQYRICVLVPAFVALGVGLLMVIVLEPGWIGGVVLVASVLAAGTGWPWARRRQRAWGYAEQSEDLLVTGGVQWRRLVAIPYGRMQYVDVQAGPLQRALGIATVTLHTASAETAAAIPGLPSAEAVRLRNRLTDLGQARGAGV